MYASYRVLSLIGINTHVWDKKQLFIKSDSFMKYKSIIIVSIHFLLKKEVCNNKCIDRM